MHIRFAVLCAASLLYGAAALAQRPELKVLVVADMEGVGGVVTEAQLGPPGFEYERFRRIMTDEVLAAVRASKAAGATTVVVTDSHGGGQNLFLEDFPRDVRIVRSWPRKGGMVAGLDSSFGAVVLIGMHASSSSPAGVRAHTWSSGSFTRMALNGNELSEGELAAATAGAMGVPTVFVSGDDATNAELRARIPNIVSVDVKQALGFHAAITMPPAESVARIEAGVKAALARRGEIKPHVVPPPFVLEIGYKHYMAAELMSYLPGTQRVGSRTIRYGLKSMDEVASFIQFAAGYGAERAP